MEIYENYSLKGLNTFGIDVPAQRFVFLRGATLDDPFRFERDVDALLESGFLKNPYLLIGEGSNMLFTRPYEGSIIKIGEAVFHGSADGHHRYLTVGARMATDEVARISVAYRYCGGMENLSAVPGTIGAAVVQNVGAYGVEMKDLVESVDVVDLVTGERRTFTNEECAFGYRTSLFKQQSGHWLIQRVKLHFTDTYRPVLTYKALVDELQRRDMAEPSQGQLRDVVTELRWSKLPRPEEYGSAGSFFKNPVVDESLASSLKQEYPDMPVYPGNKLSAGWLIDRAGWKGRTKGRAGVWPKQALVLYNTGGCTGAEVLALAEAIQQDVKQKFGVTLGPEAIIV